MAVLIVSKHTQHTHCLNTHTHTHLFLTLHPLTAPIPTYIHTHQTHQLSQPIHKQPPIAHTFSPAPHNIPPYGRVCSIYKEGCLCLQSTQAGGLLIQPLWEWRQAFLYKCLPFVCPLLKESKRTIYHSSGTFCSIGGMNTCMGSPFPVVP